MPILAGTDANASPGIPFSPRHGESLHNELELLIEAGLSTSEALRAATVLPAQHFGLHDRGVIEPGRRADLVLIDGDPIADIRATRQIRRVWCAGVEHVVGSCRKIARLAGDSDHCIQRQRLGNAWALNVTSAVINCCEMAGIFAPETWWERLPWSAVRRGCPGTSEARSQGLKIRPVSVRVRLGAQRKAW